MRLDKGLNTLWSKLSSILINSKAKLKFPDGVNIICADVNKLAQVKKGF